MKQKYTPSYIYKQFLFKTAMAAFEVGIVLRRRGAARCPRSAAALVRCRDCSLGEDTQVKMYARSGAANFALQDALAYQVINAAIRWVVLIDLIPARPPLARMCESGR